MGGSIVNKCCLVQCLLILSSTSRALVFQCAPPGNILSSRISLLRLHESPAAEGKDEEDQQKKSTNSPKRRFAQVVHERKISNFQKSSSSSSSSLSSSLSGGSSTSRTSSSYSSNSSSTNDVNKEQPCSNYNNKKLTMSTNENRYAPQQQLPSSKGISKKNMMKWNDNLSIEDLEAKLSKRWRSASSSSSSLNTKSSFVKSKPVLDPWSTAEEKSAVFNSANNNNNVALERVKRFQEKFKAGDIEVSLGQDEYYDDDDIVVEGFEDDDDDDNDSEEDEDEDDTNQTGQNSSDDHNDNSNRLVQNDDDDGKADDQWNLLDLLSSQTADRSSSSSSADKITTATTSMQSYSSTRGSDTTSTSGGFFFRQGVDAEGLDHTYSSDPLAEEEEDTKNKRKTRDTTYVPLLDKNGEEQYLTLDLALQQLNRTINAINDEIENEHVTNEDTTTEKALVSFKELGITDETILANLERMGCLLPLPVQTASCPHALEGKDLLISTHTGSGKSIAFLVPLIQKIISRDDPQQQHLQQCQVFIVAPGRELASQIVAVARELLMGTNRNVALAIGGTPFQRCYDTIRKKKPAIVVGTPGRIAELIVGREGEKSGKLKLSNCHCLVFDEFDALLQYPIHREPAMAIWNALSKLHAQKKMQTILCSATAADCKDEFLSQFLHPEYTHVSVGENADMKTTQGSKVRMSLTTIHAVVHLDHRRFAIETVRKILNTNPSPRQVLLFVNNARRVDIVVDKLAENGIIAAPLYGGSEKNDRTDVSRALREGTVGCVVCTEMAARGIDAPYLTHVINVDLPTDSSHYAHRAGRAGRGGRPGVVINLTCEIKERKVPRRFADELGVPLHTVVPRAGKLFIVDPAAK